MASRIIAHLTRCARSGRRHFRSSNLPGNPWLFLKNLFATDATAKKDFDDAWKAPAGSGKTASDLIVTAFGKIGPAPPAAPTPIDLPCGS
jgi:hypothetical protein